VVRLIMGSVACLEEYVTELRRDVGKMEGRGDDTGDCEL